jgi:hypothetical protein
MTRLCAHACKRALSRYQVRLTDGDLARLHEMCRVGQPLADRRGTELHKVVLFGSPMYAIYHRGFGRIMTFLPPYRSDGGVEHG